MKDILNSRYAQLCQELGHLQCNLEMLQDKIAQVKTEIFAINKVVPLVTPKAEVPTEQSK